MAHRDICQAKGMLMAVYAISADAAFGVLRWRSQELNVKLFIIARRLVAHLPGLLSPNPTMGTRGSLPHDVRWQREPVVRNASAGSPGFQEAGLPARGDVGGVDVAEGLCGGRHDLPTPGRSPWRRWTHLGAHHVLTGPPVTRGSVFSVIACRGGCLRPFCVTLADRRRGHRGRLEVGLWPRFRPATPVHVPGRRAAVSAHG